MSDSHTFSGLGERVSLAPLIATFFPHHCCQLNPPPSPPFLSLFKWPHFRKFLHHRGTVALLWTWIQLMAWIFLFFPTITTIFVSQFHKFATSMKTTVAKSAVPHVEVCVSVFLFVLRARRLQFANPLTKALFALPLMEPSRSRAATCVALAVPLQTEPGAVQGAGRDALPGDHHHAAWVRLTHRAPAARDEPRRLPRRSLERRSKTWSCLWPFDKVGLVAWCACHVCACHACALAARIAWNSWDVFFGTTKLALEGKPHCVCEKIAKICMKPICAEVFDHDWNWIEIWACFVLFAELSSLWYWHLKALRVKRHLVSPSRQPSTTKRCVGIKPTLRLDQNTKPIS